MHRALALLALALLSPCVRAEENVVEARPLPPGRYLAIAFEGNEAVSLRSLPALTQAGQARARFFPDQMTALPGSGRLFVFPNASHQKRLFTDVNLGTGLTRRVRIDTPYAGQFNGDGSRLYVTTLESGFAAVFDTATDTLVTTLETTPRPGEMDFDPARNELYIADNSNSWLTVYDASTNQSVRQFRAGVQNFAVAAGKIYRGEGSSAVLLNDALTFSDYGFIQCGHFVRRVRNSSDGSRVWALSDDIQGNGTIHVIDTSTDTILASYPFTGDSAEFVVDETAGLAYVAAYSEGAIVIIDLSNGAVSSVPVGGVPFTVAIVDVP